MTTYAPPRILACPSCGVPQEIEVMASGNTFGSTLWSDSYLDAPMLSQRPPFRVCPGCGGYFVTRGARELDRTRENEQRAVRPRNPDEAQCLAALEAGFPQKHGIEFAVRLFAWHRHNDRFRDPGLSKAPRPELPAWLDNARALLGLLDPRKAENRLVAAELHRQFGEFDQARQALDGIDDVELAPFVAKLRDAVERGMRQVIVLRGPEGD